MQSVLVVVVDPFGEPTKRFIGIVEIVMPEQFRLCGSEEPFDDVILLTRLWRDVFLYDVVATAQLRELLSAKDEAVVAAQR